MREHDVDRADGDQGGETLEYIQSMLGQLRGMAEAERCGMLAYLIEMAYVEVGDIIRDDGPPHGEY